MRRLAGYNRYNSRAALEMLKAGKINLDDLAPRIHDLRNRQEKLQARRVHIESFLSDRRVELASPEIVKSYVDDLCNLLNNSSLSERKAFIRSFVREVRVTGTKVLLSYNIPLSAGSASPETLVVPPIVHYGGPFWTRTRDLSLIRTAAPDSSIQFCVLPFGGLGWTRTNDPYLIRIVL